MKNENRFQRDEVISKIKELVPGCIVMKNDPTYIQGIPDLTVMKGGRCALLEVKKSARASHRPNQDYYIKLIREQGGYASFVYPENLEAVLNEAKQFLEQE